MSDMNGLPPLSVLPPPMRAPGYYWTTREDAILRAVYPQRGASACYQQLPHRTLKAIYQRAGEMGLRSGAVITTGVPPLRWPRTPELDAIIRAEYPMCTQRGSVDALGARLGRPSWWVRRTAAHLGLAHSRMKPVPWCAEETAILQATPHLGLAALQKRLKKAGYTRSETAIAVRIKHLQLSRIDPDLYSAKELAELMGVDPVTTRRWIERQGLVAHRNPDSTASAPQWRIHRRHVRAWILTHAQLVDIRRVDKFWFIDLLAHAASEK